MRLRLQNAEVRLSNCREGSRGWRSGGLIPFGVRESRSREEQRREGLVGLAESLLRWTAWELVWVVYSAASQWLDQIPWH